MTTLLKGSRKVLLGIGLASCGAAVWAYLGVTEDKVVLKAHALYDHYVKSQRFFLDPQGKYNLLNTPQQQHCVPYTRKKGMQVNLISFLPHTLYLLFSYLPSYVY